MSDIFVTERLFVRRLEGGDLDAVLAVYLSNRDYLELTEGSGGEPGRYDRGMLERDFAIAQLTPARIYAGIFRKSDAALVGVLDWMDENASDGKPWVGLMMIRADQQRRGLASEAFEGLAGHLREGGMTTVRAGVMERNPAGRALADSLGFTLVLETSMKRASDESVLILERPL